mmetsp:Transcript_42080/g.134415  ORF Transcript_42080/g.134415 Transcript_42080/m.134415 type:complete len:237 (-) Transcript_42080:10-720(-)
MWPAEPHHNIRSAQQAEPRGHHSAAMMCLLSLLPLLQWHANPACLALPHPGARAGTHGIVGVHEVPLRLLSLGGLGLLEVSVVELLGVNLGHVHLGRGGNDVGLVHAAEGHAVGLEGARDEKEPRGQLLEEHNALALGGTGEEDEHGAGGDGRTKLGGLLHGVPVEGLGDILGRVELGRLLGRLSRLGLRLGHGEFATVLLLDGPQPAAVVGAGAALAGDPVLEHLGDHGGCWGGG